MFFSGIANSNRQANNPVVKLQSSKPYCQTMNNSDDLQTKTIIFTTLSFIVKRSLHLWPFKTGNHISVIFFFVIL